MDGEVVGVVREWVSRGELGWICEELYVWRQFLAGDGERGL